MKEFVRLAKLIVPYRAWVTLGVALSVVTVLANVGLLALSSWFITSMAIAGITGSTLNYTLPAAAVRGLALTRTGGRYAERFTNHNTTFKVLSALRIWFYTKIEPHAPARLEAFRSGDLLSRIGADVDTLDDFYVRGLVPILVALLSVAAIVAFIWTYSAALALADFAFLLVAGLALPLYLARWGNGPGRELVESASELRATLVSHVDGMAELVAFGAIGRHEQKIGELSVRHDRQQRMMSRLSGATDAVMMLCAAFAMWTALLVLLPQVGRKVDGPTVAMLLVVMLGSFEAVMPLPEVARRLGEIRAAAQRLFELVDVEPANTVIRVPAHPAPLPEATDIRVRDLRFRYGRELPLALDGIDLDLPAGRKVALIGPSGAGKTSLTSVLLRFREYEGGSVKIGGTELRDLSPDDARSLFSVAAQRPHLFQTTIRENLVLGCPDADEEQILHAVEAARIGELLRSLPEGLDTEVGANGLAFSAGQGSRIAIARALLKRAPILILDEPTEGLDGPTARVLIDSVFSAAAGRSIILITHLKFGLDAVDEVVSIAHGRSQ